MEANGPDFRQYAENEVAVQGAGIERTNAMIGALVLSEDPDKIKLLSEIGESYFSQIRKLAGAILELSGVTEPPVPEASEAATRSEEAPADVPDSEAVAAPPERPQPILPRSYELADGTHISFDEDGGVSFETSATASGEPVNKELGAFFTRRNQTRLDMMRALIRELADNNGQEITGTELRAAHPEYDSGDQTLYNDLKDIRNLLGESIIFTFNGRYSTYRFEAEPVETGGSSDPEPAPAETPAANPEAERSMEDVKPLRTYRLVDGQHMRFNSDGGVTFEIDGGSDGQPVYCELWTIFGRRSAERLEMMRGLAKRLAENSGVPIQPMDLRSVHPGYETTPPWLVRDLRDLQKVLGESLLSEGWARGSRYTFVGQLIEAEEQPEPSPIRPKRPAAGVAVAKQPTPEAAYPADDFLGENIITRGLLDYNSGLSLLRERAADGRDLFLPVADNFRKVVELIMSRQSSNGILEIDVQQLINEAKQAADKQDKLRTWAEIRSSIIGPLDILSSQFRSIEAIRDPSGDIVQVLVSLTPPEA